LSGRDIAKGQETTAPKPASKLEGDLYEISRSP
jgi:hypothetical protein